MRKMQRMMNAERCVSGVLVDSHLSSGVWLPEMFSFFLSLVFSANISCKSRQPTEMAETKYHQDGN